MQEEILLNKTQQTEQLFKKSFPALDIDITTFRMYKQEQDPLNGFLHAQELNQRNEGKTGKIRKEVRNSKDFFQSKEISEKQSEK